MGPFLGLAPNTVVVDMGSNLDCRPSLLLDFAAMGSVFAHRFLSIERPRIGLLSVGSEEAKGNRQVRDGYQLFKESNLNFIGNVEGMDFFTGKADVIVCDGFVGNVLMKFTEGPWCDNGRISEQGASREAAAGRFGTSGCQGMGSEQPAQEDGRSTVRR